jgi:preprotein translocase subunit SecG
MTTILLILHLMIAAALVGVVLLQRSEGGALGIGGGGGFMTGRGAANFLTRVTASLAAAFFFTSLVLTLIAARTERPHSILDTPASAPLAKEPASPSPAPSPAQGAPPAQGGILDKLAPATPKVRLVSWALLRGERFAAEAGAPVSKLARRPAPLR